MHTACNQSESEEVVFFNVYGIFLRWTKQSFFSYLGTPRPNHGLMYILCEHVRIEYPDGTIDIFDRGDIIYIPKGLRYSVKFSGNTEHLEALLINFSAEGALPSCNQVTRPVTDATASYIDPFSSIISLYTQTKNCRYAIMAHFYDLLNKISSHMESEVTATPAYRSIAPAVTYIDSHINMQLRVPYLAKLCLLSESVFRKRFKTCMGKTPTEYITDLKLEKATELLKNSDIPISTIVSELNFYDVAYFHKLFRKKNGVAPSAFRRAHTQGEGGPQQGAPKRTK